MVYLGDELGLYRSMRNAGPLTSRALSERTGLNERWLREWLHGQAAAGLLDYDGKGAFELSDEAALVLADESTPASGIGMFHDLPGQLNVLYRCLDAFRTGLGFTYDAGGESIAIGVERMFAPWSTTALISEALPQIDGVMRKLEAGAEVADVGAGSARAVIALAQAFPNSMFHAYDNSKFALARAAQNVEAAAVANVRLHNPDEDPLPGNPTFDLVMCLDCLHDMTRPDLAAQAIRKAIKPDGSWFIVDIECSHDPAENVGNPLGAMIYGFSILTCLASSASSEDGLALGTAGLPEPKMRELVTNAGFGSFERVPGLVHPFNAYYVARP
jgi:SAM-dependent methyltransferase